MKKCARLLPAARSFITPAMPAGLPSKPVVTPIRVALIEDHRAYRESLAALLRGAPGFLCVGEFASGEEALAEFPRLKVDVALVDLALGGISGLDCIRGLRHLQPGLHVLVLTNFDDVNKVFSAIQAGAHGYLWKRTSFPRVIEAITEVHGGGAPITPHLARRMLEELCAAAQTSSATSTPLTDKETEVLELLARGMSNKEIADKLGRALPTIKDHLRHIYEKLHVHSRVGAVAKYLKPGG